MQQNFVLKQPYFGYALLDSLDAIVRDACGGTRLRRDHRRSRNSSNNSVTGISKVITLQAGDFSSLRVTASPSRINWATGTFLSLATFSNRCHSQLLNLILYVFSLVASPSPFRDEKALLQALKGGAKCSINAYSMLGNNARSLTSSQAILTFPTSSSRL